MTDVAPQALDANNTSRNQILMTLSLRLPSGEVIQVPESWLHPAPPESVTRHKVVRVAKPARVKFVKKTEEAKKESRARWWDSLPLEKKEAIRLRKLEQRRVRRVLQRKSVTSAK